MDSNINTNNTNDSFEQLLNQYLPVNKHWFSSDRARPRFRAGAVRPRRSSTLQRGVELRSQYARILANFRSKRARKTILTNRQSQSVHSLEILKSPVVAKDQKSLTGLLGILDSDVLSELTDEDASLCLMKRAIINRDYEGFCRIDSYIKSFWHCAAVVDGCIIVDNRIAIPMCLRQPLLSQLHRSHAVQLAMVDAAQYIWWPRMHRDIVQHCKDCPQCTKFGKNLKANASFNSSKPLPLLSGPNEELQLDYAGPLLDSFGNSMYTLVAIDRYSKYPSAMITRSTGGRKIIKFLKSYIQQHSIPKSIKTDQCSGFKNKLVQNFCQDKKIAQYFCPVGNHRGCGLVEKSIQTIKRRLGGSRLSSDFSNVQDTLKIIIEDNRITKNSVTGISPFELHFGRPPNTELSIAAEPLSTGVNLDNQQLERDLLTPEQRREHCDSRPRIKVVRKGQTSPTVSPYFGGLTDSVSNTPHYRALENLAHSANQWLTLKKSLSHQEGVKVLKTLTDRNQVLAATLRSNLSAGTFRFRNKMQTDQIHRSLPKRNLDYLVLNEPNKVEILRKFLNRKSDREFFKPFKGKIVRITVSTYISDKGKVVRRNHLAVRLKSTDLSFSGKQLTPVKKGQKRPIVSSSPSSSEDNRPLKQSSSRQRITAKTVKIPAHPKLPSLPTSYTPSCGQIVSTKSKETSVSEAPGVQTIPSPQHSTPVVDLTASSSTSGNQGMEVPISIKPKSPISVIKNPVCPDLIPISSDDKSSIPKSQEGTSANLAASGFPTHGGPVIMSEPDGNVSSSLNLSRASSRRKKQTTFYGSPIRHSVNITQSQSMSTPPSTPASPDKKIRFVVTDLEPVNQARLRKIQEIRLSRTVSENKSVVFGLHLRNLRNVKSLNFALEFSCSDFNQCCLKRIRRACRSLWHCSEVFGWLLRNLRNVKNLIFAYGFPRSDFSKTGFKRNRIECRSLLHCPMVLRF